MDSIRDEALMHAAAKSGETVAGRNPGENMAYMGMVSPTVLVGGRALARRGAAGRTFTPTIRVNQMRGEGHAPQRHGAQISDKQLTDRALYGKDPMTSTTTDGVHGGQHPPTRHATKFNSDEAMVRSDNHLRNHQEFDISKSKAEANGKSRFAIDRPLNEVFPDGHGDHVSGVSRVGSKKHPTGNPPGSKPAEPTNCSNGGTVRGVYEINSDGPAGTKTLYPRPRPADQ